MIIYKAENLINGKIYIGKTNGCLANRQRGHLNSAKKGAKTIFYNAIRKHGEENFIFSVLDECLSKEELNDKEKFYIKQFNSKIPNGYNMTDGGDGNDGTIKPNLGKHLLEETKDKIRLANLGKKHSGATRKKMKESHIKSYAEGRSRSWNKGLPKELHPNYGKKMSEEQKKKISLSKSGEKNHNFGKPNWNSGLIGIVTCPKGLIPWNKGLTKETDTRMATIATKVSETLKGNVPWNKGLNVTHSEESNLKRSLTMKGRPKSQQIIQNMILAQQARRNKERMMEAA
jgi:group I intron endonuclease